MSTLDVPVEYIVVRLRHYHTYPDIESATAEADRATKEHDRPFEVLPVGFCAECGEAFLRIDLRRRRFCCVRHAQRFAKRAQRQAK